MFNNIIKLRINQRKLKPYKGVCIANFNYTKKANLHNTIDHTKVPLDIVKKQNGILFARLLTMLVAMLMHHTRSESNELTTKLLRR